MPFPRIVTTLFAVLVASPALAGSPCTDPPVPDFGPLAAEPTVLTLAPADIKAICDAQNAFRYILACADEVYNVVFLTEPAVLKEMGLSGTDIACLEAHERAHLWHADGTRWPGNHRGLVSQVDPR